MAWDLPLPAPFRAFRGHDPEKPDQPAPEVAAAQGPGLRFYTCLAAGLLLVAVMVSGMGVIYVKHQSRELFIELQGLRRQRDALDIQWTQLQLEQSTLVTEAVVDQTARTRLDMIVPTPDSVVYLRR